jgi:hypothetical protein
VLELDLDHEFEPGLPLLHANFWPTAMPVWEEADLVRDREAAQRLIGLLGDEAIALLRWHGAVIVRRTLHEALFRAILAEEHAGQRVGAGYGLRSERGSPNEGKTLFSKRVRVQIRSPVRVRT